jgi:hypothetical protein
MDVKVLSQVIGFVGESVTLPCHLQLVESTLEVTQITWMREEPEDTVAVFHPKQGATYPDPKRTRFAAYRQGMDPQDMDVWDASLILAEVRAEDEANYTCTFATYPMGSRSARTQLRVLGEQAGVGEKPLRGGVGDYQRWGDLGERQGCPADSWELKETAGRGP